MKELFKITHVKDDICQVVTNLGDDDDMELFICGVISAIDKDPRIAEALSIAMSVYTGHTPDIRDILSRTSLSITPTQRDISIS